MDNYQLTQDQITAYGVCLRTEEHTCSATRFLRNRDKKNEKNEGKYLK